MYINIISIVNQYVSKQFLLCFTRIYTGVYHTVSTSNSELYVINYDIK